MKHRNTSANLKPNDIMALQNLQHSKAEINMAYDEITLQPDVLRYSIAGSKVIDAFLLLTFYLEFSGFKPIFSFYRNTRNDISKKRKNSDSDASHDNEGQMESVESNPDDEDEKPRGLWGIWPFSLLRDRPIFRLFLVILCNGILSNIFSTIFLNIEKPAQDVRLFN